MKHQAFDIPQQYMVGDIKINTKAHLDRTYTRLLLDAFVPYLEAMLTYLDELIEKHDSQLVKEQLQEVERQSKKRSTEWEQTFHQLGQTDVSEHEKIIGRLDSIRDERNALHQTDTELLKKLDIETRSQTILHHKKENIIKLLQRRQEMIEECTWEKIGDEDKMFHLFSIIGDESLGFGFSKITLQASPINDIYGWITQYHPNLLPPGDPFPPSPAPKETTAPEKKGRPPKPQTEFPGIPDAVTAHLRTFLAIKRPTAVFTKLELIFSSSYWTQ